MCDSYFQHWLNDVADLAVWEDNSWEHLLHRVCTREQTQAWPAWQVETLVKGKCIISSSPMHFNSTDQMRQKRGQQWTREEEVALWKLRRQGMEFGEIAVCIPSKVCLPFR